MPSDPIRDDDARIERVRKRWPHKPEDEILQLLALFNDELDEQEKRDAKG